MTLEEIKDGKVFLIDKPLDWSSFQVVNCLKSGLKRYYKVKKIKIGHAGTLDPRATGLLIICVGKATKKIPGFQDDIKEYTGTFKIGATTASYDTEEEENATFPTEHITEELIQETALKFIGDIQQKPPVFSALRKNGKRLYKFARAGQEVEVPMRTIHISEFEITNINLPFIDFRVVSSKGTYIRSLAFDFGKALNSGGYLHALRRTKTGDFNIENAITTDQFLKLFPLNKKENENPMVDTTED